MCSNISGLISKAFNLEVDENMLCKLEKAGCHGTVLQWFQSYFQGRGQKVRIQNIESTRLEVMIDTPQGTALSQYYL